jgi:hypothetical protein
VLPPAQLSQKEIDIFRERVGLSLSYDVKNQQIISLNNEKYVLAGLFTFFDDFPDVVAARGEIAMAINLESTMTTLNRALEQVFDLTEVPRLCHNWNLEKPAPGPSIPNAKRAKTETPKRILHLSIDSTIVAHGSSIRYWLAANTGFAELTSAKLICLLGDPLKLELFKTGDQDDYVYYCAVTIKHPDLPEGKDGNSIPDEIAAEWDKDVKFPWGKTATYPVNLSIVSKYDRLSKMLYDYLYARRKEMNIMGLPQYLYTDYPSCPVPGKFQDKEGTIKVHNLTAFEKRLEMKKSALSGHMVPPGDEPKTGLRPAIDAANYRLFSTNIGPREQDKTEVAALRMEQPWRIFMGGANWFKDIPPQFSGGRIVGRPLPRTEPQWVFFEED